MKKIILRILPFSHHHSFRQFYKFAIVGVSNTAIDFIIYFTLTRTVSFFETYFIFANIMSFSVAVTNSFFWNRRWTFKSTESSRVIQYIKFFIVNITALGINTTILYILVTYIGLHDVIAKVVAIFFSLFWNFFLNRIWVFRVVRVAKVG